MAEQHAVAAEVANLRAAFEQRKEEYRGAVERRDEDAQGLAFGEIARYQLQSIPIQSNKKIFSEFKRGSICSSSGW